jgi:O-antigen ligase
MDFALFILVNAVLFIRPAEIVPALLGLPLYEGVILACLAASLPAVVRQLRPDALVTRPVTACVLGLLVAVVLSHLTHFSLWGVRTSGFLFAKVLLYYLLLVAVVNTSRRLRRFLLWMIVFVTFLGALAVAQYHGLVNVPSLATLEEREEDPHTGELVVVPRLRSTGIYHDPNDLSQILIVGVLLCLYVLFESRSPVGRLACVPPLALFAYGLVLTRSRGGFLALVAGLVTLFQARFGWRKTLLLAGAGLPLLLVLFSGRQTTLSTAEGTGQDRIQLWAEGLGLFREAPLFGIGQGEFADRVGLVAHNSFVHCFAELGLAGGDLFLGAFGAALWMLARLNASRDTIADRRLRRLSPYLLAVTAAYAVGLLTLSRAYVPPTYAILGLATAHAAMACPTGAAWRFRFDGLLLRRLAAASAVYLAGVYVFVRVFVRWSA